MNMFHLQPPTVIEEDVDDNHLSDDSNEIGRLQIIDPVMSPQKKNSLKAQYTSNYLSVNDTYKLKPPTDS